MELTMFPLLIRLWGLISWCGKWKCFPEHLVRHERSANVCRMNQCVNNREFGAAPVLPEASTPEVSPGVGSILVFPDSPLLLPTHRDLNGQNPECSGNSRSLFPSDKGIFVMPGCEIHYRNKDGAGSGVSLRGWGGAERKISQGSIGELPTLQYPLSLFGSRMLLNWYYRVEWELCGATFLLSNHIG